MGGNKLTNGEKHSREKIEVVLEKVAETMPIDVTMIPAGSYRRGCEECGDLDIVVMVSNDGQEQIERVLETFGVDPFTKSGKLRSAASFVLDDVQVDFVFTVLEEVGAALMYLTGPDRLNVRQRVVAQRLGFMLNHKGLFQQMNEDDRSKPDYVPKSGRYGGRRYKRIAGVTEREIYSMLGEDWLEPEEREEVA